MVTCSHSNVISFLEWAIAKKNLIYTMGYVPGLGTPNIHLLRPLLNGGGGDTFSSSPDNFQPVGQPCACNML
jgi:hypothetical protein